MYEIYEMYKCIRQIKYMKNMRKYETDGRYPSQYGFTIEPEAGNKPEICLSGAKVPESLHWQFNSAEN